MDKNNKKESLLSNLFSFFDIPTEHRFVILLFLFMLSLRIVELTSGVNTATILWNIPLLVFAFGIIPFHSYRILKSEFKKNQKKHHKYYNYYNSGRN